MIVGTMTMPCVAVAPRSSIAVETPELVTVRFDDTDVVFTREEFSRIEASARASGKSVTQWFVDAVLDEAARSLSTLASRHGLA